MVVGDALRDWIKAQCEVSVFPYDVDFQPNVQNINHPSQRYLWIARTCLANNKMFGGKTKVETGLNWYEYGRLTSNKLRTPLSIVFGEVATHNHFVLDRGGKVFNRTAPVIKLPSDASEVDHMALLGLLNSSTACFWLKQVCHNKGSTVDQHGARQRTDAFEDFYQYNGTKLQQFPLPDGRPTQLAQRLDSLAQRLQDTMPAAIITPRRQDAKQNDGTDLCTFAPLRESLTAAHVRYERLRGLMIFLQEELDWACYKLYGLIDDDLTSAGDPFPLAFGERSFEILLARSVARHSVPPTTWFKRHNAKPITAPPEHWPEDYIALYHRRHDVQQSNRNLALIEQPEYKRRWNTEPWDSQVKRALKSWLLDRLERHFDFDGRMNDEGKATAQIDVSMISVSLLADIAAKGEQFMKVGSVYHDDPAFNVSKLVEELVAADNVPLLPVLRYKPTGLRKREQWEETWELQRKEDAGEDVGDIPVPPKYKSSDLISTGGAKYWKLRGKLDVPKERWISFPHCQGEDGTLMICWAGYDHLQQAKAISAHFVDVQERLGGRDDPRLIPLLACLIELLPWLKQWHNEVDPEFGMAMGDYFDGFITEEARNLDKTVAEIKAWQPPQRAGGRRRKRSNT